MTSVSYSQLHPDEAILLGRVWFKTAGSFNTTVPASTKFARAVALGCGGQGQDWGGSGARARSVVAVTPGDNLVIQVGDTSTATVLGDSFVKTNSGAVICYADRGRGNGNGGLAANSIGDVTIDGAPGSDATGVGGAAASDATDYDALGFGGMGAIFTSAHAPAYGGGGHLFDAFDAFGNIVGPYTIAAGGGLVCLEYFDSNPGY